MTGGINITQDFYIFKFSSGQKTVMHSSVYPDQHRHLQWVKTLNLSLVRTRLLVWSLLPGSSWLEPVPTMEEILETRQHKSVEHRWKRKVWVSLYLSPIFFFHSLYFREYEREGFISQTEAISVACKGVVGHSSWWDIPFTRVEHRERWSSCINVCCTLFTMGI